MALQAEFVKDFPFDRMRARVGEANVRLAIGELSRQRTTRFVGLLALFLYWSMLAEGAGHSVQPKQLSSLYCAVQHYVFTVRERMKRQRTQLLFVLPLLLMLARYAVEALFRQAYPKWWTTIDARDTGTTSRCAGVKPRRPVSKKYRGSAMPPTWPPTVPNLQVKPEQQ